MDTQTIETTKQTTDEGIQISQVTVKRSNQPMLLIVLVVLAIIIIALVIVNLLSMRPNSASNNNLSASITPQITTTPTTTNREDWITYKSSALNLEFEYPNNGMKVEEAVPGLHRGIVITFPNSKQIDILIDRYEVNSHKQENPEEYLTKDTPVFQIQNQSITSYYTIQGETEHFDPRIDQLVYGKEEYPEPICQFGYATTTYFIEVVDKATVHLNKTHHFSNCPDDKYDRNPSEEEEDIATEIIESLKFN